MNFLNIPSNISIQLINSRSSLVIGSSRYYILNNLNFNFVFIIIIVIVIITIILNEIVNTYLFGELKFMSAIVFFGTRNIFDTKHFTL